MFIAGDAGSGRSALMRSLPNELGRIQPHPTVIAGGFQDGTYAPWDSPRLAPDIGAAVDRLLAASEAAAGITSGFLPYAALIKQAASASKLGLEFAKGLVAKSGPPELASVMPRLPRRNQLHAGSFLALKLGKLVAYRD